MRGSPMQSWWKELLHLLQQMMGLNSLVTKSMQTMQSVSMGGPPAPRRITSSRSISRPRFICPTVCRQSTWLFTSSIASASRPGSFFSFAHAARTPSDLAQKVLRISYRHSSFSQMVSSNSERTGCSSRGRGCRWARLELHPRQFLPIWVQQAASTFTMALTSLEAAWVRSLLPMSLCLEPKCLARESKSLSLGLSWSLLALYSLSLCLWRAWSCSASCCLRRLSWSRKRLICSSWPRSTSMLGAGWWPSYWRRSWEQVRPEREGAHPGQKRRTLVERRDSPLGRKRRASWERQLRWMQTEHPLQGSNMPWTPCRLRHREQSDTQLSEGRMGQEAWLSSSRRTWGKKRAQRRCTLREEALVLRWSRGPSPDRHTSHRAVINRLQSNALRIVPRKAIQYSLEVCLGEEGHLVHVHPFVFELFQQVLQGETLLVAALRLLQRLLLLRLLAPVVLQAVDVLDDLFQEVLSQESHGLVAVAVVAPEAHLLHHLPHQLFRHLAPTLLQPQDHFLQRVLHYIYYYIPIYVRDSLHLPRQPQARAAL